MAPYNLDHLFSQAPVAVCIVSGKGYKVEMVNEKMLEFLGRTKDIIGKPLGDSLTEIKEQGLLTILERVTQTGEPSYLSNFPAAILINGVREMRYFNLVFKPYFLHPEDRQPNAIFCVAHNITPQILTLQSLQDEKRRTALALETGELGMLATDWKANAATADKRACEIFGLEEGPLPLEEYINCIHPEDRKIREHSIQEGIETGTFDFEVRLLLKDKSIRWMRSKGIVQKDAEENLCGTFGIVQDVTPQKEFALALQRRVEERTAELAQANKSLLEVNQELMRSNQNLEEFTRAASHDLKEPVRKIRVFASRLKEMLADRLTTEEAAMFLRMEKAAERMGLLVDDLLEYSQLNQSAPEKEDIDLAEKINNILNDLELMVQEKGARIDVEKMPVIKGHRRQLQQLFQNLLINALKYSRPGLAPHVRITSKVVIGKENGTQVPSGVWDELFYLVEVSDNGIGFDQNDAERIFQVFTRLHGNKEYSGAGIGLSIAKKVMENHNGYIYAKGKPNGGASFCMLFPIEQ